MLEPDYGTRFKKDLKKYQHKKKVLKELDEVLAMLLAEKKLPEKYVDHPLTGDRFGSRECHVKPDVLLIYNVNGNVLYLSRIGSHSELF